MRVTMETRSAMTRDGAALLTDVYFTDSDSRRPALLVRTPYPRRSSAADIDAIRLADYVLAETTIVDVHDPMLTLKGLRLYYERNACPKA